MTERVVVKQFIHHTDQNGLLPVRQSAYGRFNSTESAVLVVHNNIVRAIDDDHVAALALLDLSSAFDSVDHSTLLSILRIQALRHRTATRVVLFIPNWTYAGV